MAWAAVLALFALPFAGVLDGPALASAAAGVVDEVIGVAAEEAPVVAAVAATAAAINAAAAERGELMGDEGREVGMGQGSPVSTWCLALAFNSMATV